MGRPAQARAVGESVIVMTFPAYNVDALRDKRVLLRVDLDVPVVDGQVAGAFVRLKAAVRTIGWLQQAGARVVVLAHRGRPKGTDPAWSLRPVVDWVGERLRAGSWLFAGLPTREALAHQVETLTSGDVLFLENVRFHAGEEANDEAFSAQLAALGEVYINDAFATCHRAHASTGGVGRYLPALAGPTILQEIQGLEPLMQATRHPYVAIIGGAKISTKLSALKAVQQQADQVFVGGAIATQFFAARGVGVGRSSCDTQDVALAETMMALPNIVLPEDVLVRGSDDTYKVVAWDAVPDDGVVVDVGPRAIARMGDAVRASRLCVWNGPLGQVEQMPSRVGTDAMAHVVASVGRTGAYVAVGGSDTVAVLEALQLDRFIDHVSTGGGAMLEYIGHDVLPGLDALTHPIHTFA